MDKTAIKNFIKKMSDELPNEMPEVLPKYIKIIVDYGHKEILVEKQLS